MAKSAANTMNTHTYSASPSDAVYNITILNNIKKRIFIGDRVMMQVWKWFIYYLSLIIGKLKMENSEK